MVISGVFGLMGALLGWGLNQLTYYLDNKPKLVFVIVRNDNPDIIEPEHRTKTSISEYRIEMANVGKVPVILESISLYYKQKLLIDCSIEANQRKILPYHSKYYEMMEQDREALQWHCKKKQFSECDIVAYCFSKQEIKGKLDVFEFYGRAKLEMSHDENEK